MRGALIQIGIDEEDKSENAQDHPIDKQFPNGGMVRTCNMT